MKALRQSKIKNTQNYFFSRMTNIENFDPSLLSIDKVSFEKNTDCVIYEIEYFKNFNNKNSLYLVFNNVDVYIELNPSEDDSEYTWFLLLQTEIEKH